MTPIMFVDICGLASEQLETLFVQQCVYGNIISFLDYYPDPTAIAKICAPYYRVTPIEFLINALVSR
ncbi:MAG: hypothetical protein SWX82_02995 [Cyanobacteriota bacterium]|nr:hypothetical protein [Cyanobacteriota bacterium]